MIIPPDLKVTTEILWRGALLFAIIDLVFVSVVVRIIKPGELFRMKWNLVIVMALFFCILFGSVVSVLFWDSVYSYVFPAWARWIVPLLTGTSPVAALTIAAFEFIFYWCICLTILRLILHIRIKITTDYNTDNAMKSTVIAGIRRLADHRAVY